MRTWWVPGGTPRIVKRPSAPVSPPSVVPTICTWACPTGCWFAASVTRTVTRPCWAWAVNAVATNATAIVAAHRTRFDGEDLILGILLNGEKRRDPALPGTGREESIWTVRLPSPASRWWSGDRGVTGRHLGVLNRDC